MTLKDEAKTALDPVMERVQVELRAGKVGSVRFAELRELRNYLRDCEEWVGGVRKVTPCDYELEHS